MATDHEQQAREMINRNGAMIVGEGWCVSGAKLASLQSELAALLAREGRMREALEAVLTEAADNMIALDCRRAIEAALAPIAAEPAQPAPVAQPDSLRDRMQQQCSDWRVYWRAPDAHGVDMSMPQAAALLRDALGVEVEIKCMHCLSTADDGEQQRLPPTQPDLGQLLHDPVDDGAAWATPTGSGS